MLPIASLMYRKRLPVGEQFRSYELPACVLMALVLLVPAACKRRLYRWQGAACLGIYLVYLAAVLLAPRAGACPPQKSRQSNARPAARKPSGAAGRALLCCLPDRAAGIPVSPGGTVSPPPP